jgi:acyl-CoA thioester hydrolase
VITERGFGIDTIRRTKTGPVILEVTLKFVGELFPRDVVVIRSTMLAYERKVGKMSQQMLKGGTDLVCEAVFTFGLFDIEKRRLIEPTPEWAHAVGLDEAI